MKKIIYLLLFVLMISLVYAQEAETIIDNTTNTAYVNDGITLINISKFEAASNEEVQLNIKSEDIINEVCFEFPINTKDIDIRIIKVDVPFWFDKDLKDYETKTENKICYTGLELEADKIYYEANYNGIGKIKYNITADETILDPYLVGSISTDNNLVLYLPFNNSINNVYSNILTSFSSINTRYQSLSDVFITSGDCANTGNMHDGVISTYGNTDYQELGTANNNCYAFWDFNKTGSDTGARVEVILGTGKQYYNFTIPTACFNAYTDKISVRTIQNTYRIFDGTFTNLDSRFYLSCDVGGSNWLDIDSKTESTACSGECSTSYILGVSGLVPYIYINELRAYYTNQSNFNLSSLRNVKTSYIMAKNLTFGQDYYLRTSTINIVNTTENAITNNVTINSDGALFNQQNSLITLYPMIQQNLTNASTINVSNNLSYYKDLVLYLSFDNSTISGTNVIDSAGFQNATLNGSVITNQAGKFGNSIFCNDSMIVHLAGRSYYDFIANGTWNYWVRNTTPNTAANGNAFIVRRKQGGTVQYQWFSGTPTNNYRMYNGGEIAMSPNVYVNNKSQTWEMVTMQKKGTNVSIYINGVYNGSAAVTFNAGTESLGICNAAAKDQPSLSNMDEIMMWNRTLNDSEILGLYNSGNGLNFGNFTTITTQNVSTNITINVTQNKTIKSVYMLFNTSDNLNVELIKFDDNTKFYNTQNQLDMPYNFTNYTLGIYPNGTIFNGTILKFLAYSIYLTETERSLLFNDGNYSKNLIATEQTNIINIAQYNLTFIEPNLNNFSIVLNNSVYSLYDNSLIAMYNFDNVSSLGENNTNIKDMSGNNNNGNCSNCPVLTTGKYGNAYLFNGINNNFTINITAIPLNNYTICAWVNTLNSSSDKMVIGSNINYRTYMSVRGNNCYPRLTAGGISATTVDYNINICNQWTQICSVSTTYNITHNSLNLYVNSNYINGNYYNISVAGGVKTSTIGSLSTGTYFNGSIDEVRIYNRTLSANEISQLYSSNLNKFSPNQWNFTINVTSYNNQLYNITSLVNNIYNDLNLYQLTNITERKEHNTTIYLNSNYKEYIEINNTFLNNSNIISVNFWAKRESNPSNTTLFENSNLPNLDFRNDNFGALTPALTSFGSNTKSRFNLWDMWTYTNNGTYYNIYKNGVNVESSNITTANYAYGISRIGGTNCSFGCTNLFNGYLDEFMVFNRVLTQQDILELYGGYNSSVYIYVYDAITGRLIQSPITIELRNNAINYSNIINVITGRTYVNTLSAGDYNILAYGDGFDSTTATFNLSSNEQKQISLFLTNSTSTGVKDVILYVWDETRTFLEDATINVYYQNNSGLQLYSTYYTNLNGQALAHLVRDTKYYAFSVYYKNTKCYETIRPFIITSADDSIYFSCLLNDNYIERRDSFNNINMSINCYNTTNVTGTYSVEGTSATNVEYCVELRENGNLFNTNCQNTTHYLFTYNADVSNRTSTTTIAANIYKRPLTEKTSTLVDQCVVTYYNEPKLNLGSTGLFILLVALMLGIIFLRWPVITVLYYGSVFAGATFIGIINIPFLAVNGLAGGITILIISLIVAYTISQRAN